MTALSDVAEIRKYSALAWALVITLVGSVSLFVTFLNLDHARGAQSFSASAAHAATISGTRITLLIDRLNTIGREFLLFNASKEQLLVLIHELDIDTAFISFCVTEGDSVKVLHATMGGSAVVAAQCAQNNWSSQAMVAHSSHESLTTDLRIVPSSSTEASLLEVRIYDDGGREVRATLNTNVLLDATVLGNAGPEMESDLQIPQWQRLRCGWKSTALFPSTAISIFIAIDPAKHG